MHEAEPVAELFPDLALKPKRVAVELCVRENYVERCGRRWSGTALADALRNWRHWEEQRDTLTAWVEHYRRDPWFKVGAKIHNQQGTLSGMCWLAQEALSGGDRSRLGPLLDFEEHYQKVFIRRGLIIYLTLLLEEREEPKPQISTDGHR